MRNQKGVISIIILLMLAVFAGLTIYYINLDKSEDTSIADNNIYQQTQQKNSNSMQSDVVQSAKSVREIIDNPGREFVYKGKIILEELCPPAQEFPNQNTDCSTQAYLVDKQTTLLYQTDDKILIIENGITGCSKTTMDKCTEWNNNGFYNITGVARKLDNGALLVFDVTSKELSR